MWGKLQKPSFLRPILIYFEFRSKPLLITVICMDPHSPNKLFATQYCFLIPWDDTSFFVSLFLYFSFFLFWLFYVIINFYKNHFIIMIFFFSSWKLFLFFHVPGCSGIFRIVPACSGMFQNVPCSGFYRRPQKCAIFGERGDKDQNPRERVRKLARRC